MLSNYNDDCGGDDDVNDCVLLTDDESTRRIADAMQRNWPGNLERCSLWFKTQF